MEPSDIPHAEEPVSAGVSKHAVGHSHGSFPLTRRGALGLLGGAALAGVSSNTGRADPLGGVMGSAADPSGGFRVGLLRDGLAAFDASSVPIRLHALSPRPDGHEAVAMGRRPADVAFVLDGTGSTIRSTFHATQGRRFSGHGAYASGGADFLSAEIDAATGEGVVLVRSVAGGYAPKAEFPSAGVGPHELIPVARMVAVANGAKEPKSEPGIAALGRTTARSNLAVIDIATGQVAQVAAVEDDLATLSLRHLVATPDGDVVVGAQDTAKGVHDAPLIARLVGDRLRWIDPGYEASARFGGYVGQLAIDASGRYLAASGPIGGVVAVYDLGSDELLGLINAPDCCAVAADGTTGGFIAATGLGEVIRIASHEGGAAAVDRRITRLRWDNHLTPLA